MQATHSSGVTFHSVDIVGPSATGSMTAVSGTTVLGVGAVSVGSGETFSSVLDSKVSPVVSPGELFALSNGSTEPDSTSNGTVSVISEATNMVCS